MAAAPVSTAGAPPDFAEELATWEDAAASEARLREVLREVPGPCVLDVREEIILGFAQGSWCLVERDLSCAFSEPLAARLCDCLRKEVQTSLAVRRELINYKKLCLHLWKSGSTLEKDLRQLASFWYCDMVSEVSEEQRRTYSDVSNVMNECRGTVNAIWDARYFGKTICNIPRHPESGVPWKFEELPESLEVWKAVERAKQFLLQHEEVDAYYSAKWNRRKEAEEAGMAEEPDDEAGLPAKPMKKQLRWRSERELVPSALCTEPLEHLLALVDASGLKLPAEALRYIRLVLISRGAAKAQAIKGALARYVKALTEVLEDARRVSAELQALQERPGSASEVSAGLHLHCRKFRKTLVGVVTVMPEMLRWLEPILAMRPEAERLFVSGAKGAAAFAPKGFADVLEPYRAYVREHRGNMLAELAAGRWPKSARPKPDEEVNLQPCKRCGERYTRLWLHRELCFKCEADVRAEGRCPFREACGARSFCPHEHRCFVCEQWSCEQCRILRGDGEDVWQLVESSKPAAIFLDFDRTLATTKAGASPLTGNHTVDSDLAAVCKGYGRVTVVTRSSRTEDIMEFLASKDVPVLGVRSVKRENLRSKTEVILEAMAELPPEAGAVFVDDDIKELTEPGLAPLVEQGKLMRFLFVRAGGKE